MARAILQCVSLLAAILRVASVSSCTPIYPGCTCRTENLTCDKYNAIRRLVASRYWSYRTPGNTTASISASNDALQANPSFHPYSLKAGDWLGGLVRLIWHDAAEFDPDTPDNLRPDGCLDLRNPDHSGLEMVIRDMDELWRPVCSQISRADFWVLAAKTGMEEANSYTDNEYGCNVNALDRDIKAKSEPRSLLRGIEVLQAHVLPFRYGRVDVPTCEVPSARMPNAEKSPRQVETYVMKKFNISARLAVALLGAHTLGRADVNFSGYNSSWKERPDMFTTAYFKNLAVSRWDRAAMRDPRTNAQIFQWNSEKAIMMLPTDMQLVYAIDPEQRATQPYAASCGPMASEMQKKNASLRCPNVSSVYPELNFQDYVLEFAEGETATHDEPGASKWMIAFSQAFRKMTEAGYDEDDLQCPLCPPPHCTNCPVDVLCGCGGLFDKQENSLAPPCVGNGGGRAKAIPVTTTTVAGSGSGGTQPKCTRLTVAQMRTLEIAGYRHLECSS